MNSDLHDKMVNLKIQGRKYTLSCGLKYQWIGGFVAIHISGLFIL